MGWEGDCTIEVKKGDSWEKLGIVDVRAFINRRTGCFIDCSFVETIWEEESDDSDGMAFESIFLWEDFIKATLEEIEKGHFRKPDEVINNIYEELALTILENTEKNISMRITCSLAY